MKVFIFTILCLALTGCSGIRPMKKAEYNGSVGKQIRLEQSGPAYHSVTISPAETNHVTVKIEDNGVVLTNIPLEIVRPADVREIRINNENKERKVGFWENYLKGHIITLVVVFLLTGIIGFKRVGNFIVSALSKKPKKVVDKNEPKV